MLKRKRKKSGIFNDDMKVTMVVIVLGVVAVVFFLFLPKPKKTPLSEKVLAVTKALKAYPVINPVTVKKLPPSSGKIAIIIDDWGQSLSNCKYLKEIPEPLAVSILPGLRHTKDVAKCAGLYNKMTMLHLPMEALYNYDFFYSRDYIIKTTMPAALVQRILDEDLQQLPSIEGVNNHMGSKATADKTLMKIIFRTLKKKGLFFVDSMTSPHSVCAALADELDLAFSKRDVFLDNINTREAIIKQIMTLAQKAHRRGYAVAIGHDRHLTMQVLKEQIPLLEAQGFEIVSIKDLLKR